ncbi:MAG: DUF1846 domain-containing protein [Oscillospiraceae bacterium]|nr:DUF1846 domain-containing protein [Oscillospiraceae bacterium]
MNVRQGFDNSKYLELQSARIRERIGKFGGKLYLEFGGKLFDDKHASRVLPGFQPDSKVKMLLTMKDQAEIIMVINANDIEKNKVRGDLGITYDQELLRLTDAFRGIGLYVGSVVITQFTPCAQVEAFQKRLENLGLRVYRHYSINNYPYDVPLIVSENGLGQNEYIETERSLVVVTAPGPGSGKMAVCLSQLYHENKRGVSAGYAKFETFPIWNLPLNHPVNLAYEAATTDLSDVNMIDPFHFEAYGQTTVNYNRDVEIYPVLKTIFESIYGSCPYKSPTDMGVNMAGSCITDDAAVCDAANREIIRRWYEAACAYRKGNTDKSVVQKNELIMTKAGLSPADRKVVAAARGKEELTGEPAAAIELCDGRIVTGKTSKLLGACAALLLNAVKTLAGIPDDIHLISPSVIEPIQDLKVNKLGGNNPRLHTDEVLIALAICAAADENAVRAMDQLKNLDGCELHSTVMLSPADERTYKKLGVNLTCEPKYQSKKLYHS